jgi:alcohol dehydrogenase (cytochrome c)
MRWEHKFTGDLPSNLMGGVLSTAGGRVFSGAGNIFTASHDRTGRELWRYNVGGRVSSGPITWLHNGRQRVTVAAGRAIVTFE